MRTLHLAKRLSLLLAVGLGVQAAQVSHAFAPSHALAASKAARHAFVPPSGPYWVGADGDGSDTTGDGSYNNPFATVQKAINTLKGMGSTAVGTVYLKAGTHTYACNSGLSSTLYIQDDGASNSSRLVISGTDPDPCHDQGAVTVTGPTLGTGTATLAAVTITGSWVTFEGIDVTHGPRGGMLIDSTSSATDPEVNVLVYDCYVYLNGYTVTGDGGAGIFVTQSSSNTTIQNTRIWRPREHCIYLNAYSGHRLDYVKILNCDMWGAAMGSDGSDIDRQHAIQFNSNGGEENDEGFRYCVVDGNMVHDSYGNATNINDCNDSQFTNNEFFNCEKAELFLSNCDNNLIAFNTLVTSQTSTGRECLYLKKFSNGNGTFNSDGNTVVSNIFCDLTGNSPGYCLAYDTNSIPDTCDYNIYFRTGSTTKMFKDELGGTSYTNLSDWVSGTGLDTHSLDGRPGASAPRLSAVGFVSQISANSGLQFKDEGDKFPSGVDFHLANGSGCIDKGTTASGVSYDKGGNSRNVGNAPDPGCYEKQ